MKKFGVLLLITVFVLMTACGEKTNIDVSQNETLESEMPQENTYTFTDDLGREVTVNNPQRVAALLGSFADMWVLAGGSVQASADDAWEDFELDMPDDAINLGKTKSISLEKLFEAEPDFIMASTNTRVHMEWKETLDQSGIPTAYFDVADFDDYLRVLKICTDITGREDLYKQNGLDVQSQIQTVIEKSVKRIEMNGVPKVLIVRASASGVVAKNSQDNVLGEMLHSLGCENIADANDSLLENISVEYVLQEDPDMIFLLNIGSDPATVDSYFEIFVKEQPVWQQLSAVKAERVYEMDKKLYNLKPNERWGEAYEKLEIILSEGK